MTKFVPTYAAVKFAMITEAGVKLANTLTLYRKVDEETVGQTLKRAKAIAGEGVRVVIINPGIESDAERAKRYEETGLEIVNPKAELPIITDAELETIVPYSDGVPMSVCLSKADQRAMAGDTTFVK